MSYKTSSLIDNLNFENKKIVIIGAGWMAEQYCNALFTMKIKNVTVISRKEESSRRCCKKYGYKPLYGGYKDNLPKLGVFDLVIVATPIHELKTAATFAINCGNKNILVEKPGALYSSILNNWVKETENTDVRIRIAFNRHTYPTLWKLKEITKEEKITSCFYTFTEWVHTINFTNNQPDVYKRWGIANSLHLISMAHNLIGMPKEISSYRSGSLTWHPSGAQFVGAGVTETDIPFSYQADWESAGRWGIEIMTNHSAYRLIPLEKLYRCSKGSVNWEEIGCISTYPNVKEGVAEEITIMLNKELEKEIPLVTLKQATLLTKLAEKIFGYSSTSQKS